ncbi:MAG: HEPN domain-containing protein [bacterium]|nr:HEPN domain-containing protein [bacterium]
MRKSSREEARRWFRQAQCDFDDALYLLEGGRFNTACFWAQQCAEKALKAFLYFKGIEIVLGHSTAELCHNAMEFDPDFESIASISASLDKYYIPTRYPNGLPGGVPAEAYTKDDAQVAVSMAQRILEFVRSKLEGTV